MQLGVSYKEALDVTPRELQIMMEVKQQENNNKTSMIWLNNALARQETLTPLDQLIKTENTENTENKLDELENDIKEKGLKMPGKVV